VNTAFPPSRACTRKNVHKENKLFLAAQIVKQRFSLKFKKAKDMKTPIDIWDLGILKHTSHWVDDGAVHLNGACKLQVYIFRSLGCCNSPTIFKGGRGLQIFAQISGKA